ncbi:MAG TPA: YihY/virulence factor BrkB family protein [Salinarimonas sp.]|jgi:membrane protein|nr:YihY/virulence factor BrkB family protein [Salinarimonas sp.]
MDENLYRDDEVAKRVKELRERDAERVARRVQEHRAKEEGRGRQAGKPTEIPAAGWKDVAWRVWAEIGNDRVGSIAAGTTFFLLLAIFPGLAALVSLYGLVADPADLERHLSSLRGVMPGGAMEILSTELHRLVTQPSDGLGFGFALGLALALWSANSGVKALFDALNVAYDEEEKRGFIALNVASLIFTLCAVVFMILVVTVVAVLPNLLGYLPLGPLAKVAVAAVPPVILAAVAVFGLAALYRYGPSRTRAKWTWITPGSIVAALVWIVASAGFSYYVSNFGSYNATYGALGAVVGMMTWIYISMWIVLVGAELNSELEHQTARDTTEGPEKPMGQRGATMADRVAPPA